MSLGYNMLTLVGVCDAILELPRLHVESLREGQRLEPADSFLRPTMDVDHVHAPLGPRASHLEESNRGCSYGVGLQSGWCRFDELVNLSCGGFGRPLLRLPPEIDDVHVAYMLHSDRARANWGGSGDEHCLRGIDAEALCVPQCGSDLRSGVSAPFFGRLLASTTFRRRQT